MTKKIKILISLIVFSFFVASQGYAQYQNLGSASSSEVKANPWFVGGMIGGIFSNNGGSFEISPLIGYKITPDVHIGSRITYIYSSYDYGGTTGNRSLNHYGVSLFGRYRFLKMLFVHAEYEVLSVEYPYDQNTNERRTINSLFIGGGLYQSMGGRGFATIAILYNLLETKNSPYSNPVIRIGFGIGL